jgi:hypothetical protein
MKTLLGCPSQELLHSQREEAGGSELPAGKSPMEVPVGQDYQAGTVAIKG